ncbi:hypothetical protein GIB67_033987 [Kingdonia uniflora]|uniref:CCHC-type domain-containing protein n=1 Tax=Kingdonia uniflora TaxID=39325 RepID=A0A7J7M696_9MAGN|nr:hypothetical protein GIB67_033987 [Kingdonia uniflora]
MKAALRNNPNVAVRIGGSNNLTRSPPTGSENITMSQPDSPSEDIQSTSKEEENKGQAIEERLVDMSTFLGSLGCKMVPITIDDWRGFDKKKLDRIWEIIKQKFVLDEHNKKYCLQSLGKLWRSYKSRLRAKIDICKSQEELEVAKPKHIDSTHWKTFAKRKSCINFFEKIEELKESSGPNSSSLSFKDDILSKLFGPEQGGRVRGLGFGVTPSSLVIISQNKGNVAELEEELAAVKKKLNQSRRDAIEEAYNLKTMKPDTLDGKLRTRDIDNYCVFDNDEKLDFDSQIALISQQFRKLLKKRQFEKQGQNVNYKSRPHNRVKSYGKQTNSSTHPHNDSDQDLNKVECYRCRKYGHYAHSCPTKSSNSNHNAMNIKVTWDDDNNEFDDHPQEYENGNYCLEKLKKEKDALIVKLAMCEKEKHTAVGKLKLTEAELEKHKLDLTFTKQKLEVFLHGAKNIDKMLSMRKNSTEKRGLGFDEQNAKSTPQITKFIKATPVPSLPIQSVTNAPHSQTK